MLEFIDTLYPNYIICGDMNSKSIEIGCKSNNESGLILSDFIVNSNAILLNNNEPTYFRVHNDYSEILDRFICSSNLYRRF